VIEVVLAMLIRRSLQGQATAAWKLERLADIGELLRLLKFRSHKVSPPRAQRKTKNNN
jgi:hypothetical protein